MRLRLVVCALVLAVAGAAPVRAEMRLAYVDVQRALNECDAGKKAKAEMQSRVQVLESRLEGERNEVQNLKDELEKKGMLMN
ncbi:MAG TPA: OmpH family outer membrane protein, partial [Candidatus Binataceae bacterium]|nr:OmpH family outer membrane protein [Candidatus Binataceae bacterium]